VLFIIDNGSSPNFRSQGGFRFWIEEEKRGGKTLENLKDVENDNEFQNADQHGNVQVENHKKMMELERNQPEMRRGFFSFSSVQPPLYS
jgi:hypothetical protein